MAEIYRSVDSEGRVTYGDLPPSGSQRIDVLGPNGQKSSTNDSSSSDHKRAVELIKEAQKRIPKIKDYLDYLDFLRHHDFTQFDRVMLELKDQDPDTWRKLSQIPQFRSLRYTALGLKAGEKHLTAGASFVAGGLAGHPIGAATGSVEKWLETTVKDMMKRDRYGPYAPVLGTKASTLPAPTPPTYSNSRLGQYLKTEDARAAGEARSAAAGMETSRAAARTGLASALSRPGGTVLDVLIGMLDPNVHQGATNFSIEIRLKRALDAGVLDIDQYTQAHNLMAQSRYKEMQDYLSSLRGTGQ